MSDSVTPPRPNEGGGFDVSRLLPQRSFGLKLILVCALALAMAIPAGFVWAIFSTRALAAQTAVYDVTNLQAGSQNLLGPVIVVPFERDVVVSVNTVNNTVNQLQTKTGRMVLYPETGEANTELVTEIRKRGLQEIPVFTANSTFKARFNPARIAAEAPTGARLRWSEARVVMNMSDLRGAKDARLTMGGQILEVAPIELTIAEVSGQPAQQIRLLGASLGWTAEPVAAPLSAEATLSVSGAQNISVSAFARDTTIRLSGNWGSPSFDSGVLPDRRTVEKERFEAEWHIPFLARGVPGVGADLAIGAVISPGATLLDEGNPYQSVERALKYAPLFIGLVFLTYFLFEVTSGKRAHPAQYVLVGLAQTIFYMLLLSISEVMGFSLGFLLAAIATVLALSLYAGAVFSSRMAVVKALAVFSALYALIYVLLRQEEYGLLVGSIASFLAIAGTMWMTRKLDWYGVGRIQPAPQT